MTRIGIVREKQMAKSIIAVLREVMGRDFTEDDLLDFAQLSKKPQQMEPHQIKKYNKSKQISRIR